MIKDVDSSSRNHLRATE